MHFKTQQEIWEFLISGGKVVGIDWDEGGYLHLKSGALVDEDGEGFWDVTFKDPELWRPYTPPEEKKYLWAWKKNNEWYQDANGRFMTKSEAEQYFRIKMNIAEFKKLEWAVLP